MKVCNGRVLCIFTESFSQAGRPVQGEGVTGVRGLCMCNDSWCRGLSEMAVGLQSARRRITLCLVTGELVGRRGERGNLLAAVGTGERAGKYRNQGKASCENRKAKG